VVLRAARDGDLDAIAELFLACWQTSYREWLPPRVVSLYGPTEAQALWRSALAKAPDERQVVVAEGPDHGVLGVVAIGLEPDRANVGHIYSLYVSPDAQGLGIGSRLMAFAIGRLVELGSASASLWVFEANADGRAFYERSGWLPDGTVRVEPEYGEQELRLTRSLPTSGDPG